MGLSRTSTHFIVSAASLLSVLCFKPSLPPSINGGFVATGFIRSGSRISLILMTQEEKKNLIYCSVNFKIKDLLHLIIKTNNIFNN